MPFEPLTSANKRRAAQQMMQQGSFLLVGFPPNADKPLLIEVECQRTHWLGAMRSFSSLLRKKHGEGMKNQLPDGRSLEFLVPEHME